MPGLIRHLQCDHAYLSIQKQRKNSRGDTTRSRSRPNAVALAHLGVRFPPDYRGTGHVRFPGSVSDPRILLLFSVDTSHGVGDCERRDQLKREVADCYQRPRGARVGGQAAQSRLNALSAPKRTAWEFSIRRRSREETT